jgi:hypothetical protein
MTQLLADTAGQKQVTGRDYRNAFGQATAIPLPHRWISRVSSVFVLSSSSVLLKS